MSKILTSEEIDGNESLVGKKLRLLKGVPNLTRFNIGDIVTCTKLERELSGNDMIVKHESLVGWDYIYKGEEWELVDE